MTLKPSPSLPSIDPLSIAIEQYKKKRRIQMSGPPKRQSYSSGDVWPNPDSVIAAKEYKAFHYRK